MQAYVATLRGQGGQGRPRRSGRFLAWLILRCVWVREGFIEEVDGLLAVVLLIVPQQRKKRHDGRREVVSVEVVEPRKGSCRSGVGVGGACIRGVYGEGLCVGMRGSTSRRISDSCLDDESVVVNKRRELRLNKDRS